jgi:hypothetical protein
MQHASTGAAAGTRRWPALIVVLVLVMTSALAGCGASAHAVTRATPTTLPTATARPIVSLPLFSDWRIAYLNDYGVLHALSLDVKTDLEGPSLGSGVRAVTISPDGHTIAYLTNPTMTQALVRLIHLQAPTMSDITTVFTTYLDAAEWSRDGSRLAVPGSVLGVTGLYLIDTHSGTATAVPQTGLGEASSYVGFEARIVGWADQSHIVVSGGRPRPAGARYHHRRDHSDRGARYAHYRIARPGRTAGNADWHVHGLLRSGEGHRDAGPCHR